MRQPNKNYKRKVLRQLVLGNICTNEAAEQLRNPDPDGKDIDLVMSHPEGGYISHTFGHITPEQIDSYRFRNMMWVLVGEGYPVDFMAIKFYHNESKALPVLQALGML